MSVNPSPIGGYAGQFFDNNGVILAGGKIYTYAAGTTTPQATYTSSSGTTPHANPIVLDSAGRIPGGEIWLTNGVAYKFTVETSLGVLLGTYDNVTTPANLSGATGAGLVGFTLGDVYPSGSVGGFLNSFFDIPDAKFEVTTTAGVGFERGIAIEHYADTTGSYGLDIHQYQGAKNALTVHCYSDENGAVAGAVAVQIDHTRNGNILVLKNAENPVTSPGTKGTANFITGVGYGGAGQTTPGTLFSWTHQNVILVPDDYWPLTVNGNGMEVIGGPTASRCFKSTSLSDTKYGIEAYGTKYGLYTATSLNDGFVASFVKNGTGTGTVVSVVNSGIGDFQIGYNGALTERYKIDSAGQYYIQGNRVLSTRQAAVAAPAGGGTIDTQARTAINDIISRLQAHGLIAI